MGSGFHCLRSLSFSFSWHCQPSLRSCSLLASDHACMLLLPPTWIPNVCDHPTNVCRRFFSPESRGPDPRWLSQLLGVSILCGTYTFALLNVHTNSSGRSTSQKFGALFMRLFWSREWWPSGVYNSSFVPATLSLCFPLWTGIAAANPGLQSLAMVSNALHDNKHWWIMHHMPLAGAALKVWSN